MMFMKMQTQWNTSMSGVIGLKYEVLQWLCTLYSVKDQCAMFEGIQIMEATVIPLLNEKE